MKTRNKIHEIIYHQNNKYLLDKLNINKENLENIALWLYARKYINSSTNEEDNELSELLTLIITDKNTTYLCYDGQILYQNSEYKYLYNQYEILDENNEKIKNQITTQEELFDFLEQNNQTYITDILMKIQHEIEKQEEQYVIKDNDDVVFEIYGRENGILKKYNCENEENTYVLNTRLEAKLDVDSFGLFIDKNDENKNKTPVNLNDAYGFKFLTYNVTDMHKIKGYDNIFIFAKNKHNNDYMGFISLVEKKDYDTGEFFKKNALKIHLIETSAKYKRKGISDYLYKQAKQFCDKNNILMYRFVRDLTIDGSKKLKHKARQHGILEAENDEPIFHNEYVEKHHKYLQDILKNKDEYIENVKQVEQQYNKLEQEELKEQKQNEMEFSDCKFSR